LIRTVFDEKVKHKTILQKYLIADEDEEKGEIDYRRQKREYLIFHPVQ
jgi:hypothetical protein